MVKNKLKNMRITAAGDIAAASAMLACMVLRAIGVQIGSRLVASKESSANINYKQAVVKAVNGKT